MNLQSGAILIVDDSCTIDFRRGGDHDRLSVCISIGRDGRSTAASDDDRGLAARDPPRPDRS